MSSGGEYREGETGCEKIKDGGQDGVLVGGQNGCGAGREEVT